MPRWLKIVLGIVAGLAVVIGVAVWVALWATSGLIEPIERQLAALKAGNMAAAYEETSEAFRQATPIDSFTAFVEGNPILRDVAEHTFSNRSVENSVGKVSGSLTSSTGGVVPVAYQLVKEHDTWKILNIDLTGG
jgi:hypothetical protein